MGMFDTIVWENDLPTDSGFLVPRGTRFQTKSLECLMELYYVDESGRWHQRRGIWEDTDEIDEFRTKIFGRTEYQTKLIEYQDLPADFHGDVEFYSSFVTDDEPAKMVWLEYRARFSNGHLDWVEYVPEGFWEREPTEGHLQQDTHITRIAVGEDLPDDG